MPPRPTGPGLQLGARVASPRLSIYIQNKNLVLGIGKQMRPAYFVFAAVDDLCATAGFGAAGGGSITVALVM